MVAVNTWRHPQEWEGLEQSGTELIRHTKNNAIYRTISHTKKEDDKSSETPPTDFPQVFETRVFREVFRKRERKNVQKHGCPISTYGSWFIDTWKNQI